MLTLNLPEIAPEVVLVRRVRKSIGIRIVDGRVEVAAHPRVSLAQLQRLLEQKSDWIRRHLLRQQAGIAARNALPEQLLLAGQCLTVEHRPALGAGVLASAAGLQVGGPESQLKPQLAQFLCQQAAQRFPPRFNALAVQSFRPPLRMQLSAARSRWGSCNQQGVIRLNWRLVQAPLEVLDYVIAHELAHLRHMNHSAGFWQETERLYPDWRATRAWLKKNGDQLFNFG